MHKHTDSVVTLLKCSTMLPNDHAQIGAVQLALDDHGQVEAEEQKVEAGREARYRRLAMINLNLT